MKIYSHSGRKILSSLAAVAMPVVDGRALILTPAGTCAAFQTLKEAFSV
jgi:hypothetical protein